MRSSRRVTLRVAPALASLASVLLFATCDFDKISGTPTPITQQEIDRLFSITPADTTLFLGGSTTLTITPGAGIDLGGTTQTWTSSVPGVVAIDSETGVATGIAIGNAVVTARVIAPELDSGYAKTRALRVRYKGIKACGASQSQCSPARLDSITGLGQTRVAQFFGTNNSDQMSGAALTGVTLATHDSGSTANTVASPALTGVGIIGRRNGVAYLVGVFETMRDSIRVKVRQVARTLLLPDYTAHHLNINRPQPAFTLRDVADSVMTSSPTMRWRSSDTTVFTIDSLTGAVRVKRKYAVGDTARILLTVDTIQRNTRLLIDQRVARLRIDTGNFQSDTVLLALPVKPSITALDSGSTPVPGVPVTFRLGAAGKAAGATITDSVHITDANGKATLGSWTLGSKSGTQTVRAVFGTDTSALFVATGLPRAPVKLGFGVHPQPAASGATITPAVTVTIQDSIGNVTTSTDSVAIAIGNNPSAATLSGTKKVAAVNGTATFSTLSVVPGGPGFTLTATSGSLTSTISNAFDVYGTATKLFVDRQPVSTSAGAIIDTIRIAVHDANNTIVATATNNVTLAIGANPGSGTLSGITTVTAVNGIATFTGLSINNAGNGYTLVATASGLTGVTTNTFNVDPVGAASKLAFTNQPPSTFGSGASQTITVAVRDANGATVGTSTASVSLQLISSVSGATLTGTVTRNAVNGIATFTGISVDKVGTGYKISATSSGLTGVESTPFSVTPGTATKLAFVNQPTHTVVSTTMSPAVTVAVQDANNNVVSTIAPTGVTVALSGCTGPTMSGTTNVNTASGVATFSALNFGANTGISCTLTATSSNLSSGTSSFFSVVSSTGAIRLSFGTQPSNTTAGNSIASFTVRAVDQNGTVVTTASPFITLTVLSGPGPIFSGASTTASSGVATFLSTQIRVAGTYKLLATATGFKPDSSISFTINPATLSKLGFVQQPADITAGVPFSPAVSVAFQDTYGNTITSQTSTITLARNVGPINSSLSGGSTTVAAENGIATFSGLTLKVASTSYNLFASTSAPATGVVSTSFIVSPGPVSTLGFTLHPSSFLTAGDSFGATVQAQDSVGNANSTFNNQISLSLTGGDPAGTLLGTTTMTPTSGTASFTGLSVQKAGTSYRINASASGLTTGQSNTFTVGAASATKLGWLSVPQNTVQKAGIDDGSGNLVRVAAQDQYGNTQTSFCCTIRIQIGNNPGGMGLLDNGFATTFKDYSTSNGAVSLSNLALSGSGTGVTLLATTPFTSLTSATSAAFDVAAFGSPAKLAFQQQPTNGTYAVALNPAISVRVEDDFGNTVTNATNAITIRKGTDPNGNTILSPDSVVAAVSGVATFSNIYFDRTGSGFTLQATSLGLTLATSSTFNITSPGFVATASSMSDMTRIGDRIYWIENLASGALKSVLVTGGPVTTHSGVTVGAGARMATDGTDLYWIEAGSGVGTGSVRRFNVASGTTTTLASSLSDIRTEANTFAVEGGRVFFHGRSQDGLTAAIKRVPANATEPTTPVDVVLRSPNSTSSTQYFTVSDELIYFFDNPTSTVQRIKWDGASLTTLTPQLFTTIQRLVLGGTTLYISSGTDIRTIADADTRSTTVTPAIPVTSLGFLYNMIIEGNNLYLKSNNNVFRYDVTTFGGTAVSSTLATNGAFSYQTLLLDGAHIYYSNNSSGIGKVVK